MRRAFWIASGTVWGEVEEEERDKGMGVWVSFSRVSFWRRRDMLGYFFSGRGEEVLGVEEGRSPGWGVLLLPLVELLDVDVDVRLKDQMLFLRDGRVGVSEVWLSAEGLIERCRGVALKYASTDDCGITLITLTPPTCFASIGPEMTITLDLAIALT